ncbi:recombinase family protein [Aquamicrobium lusatiense]|uniref:recombinase family protein n=1 Tax=Aquamicrobium lusatiense TaxID=89772 RepID=UPI002454BC4D|nr:recombinase family protein [Aquamicrobium lusatiense]MDH4992090.1 recombinase family protein [Aquamicrobium lusatiense]
MTDEGRSGSENEERRPTRAAQYVRMSTEHQNYSTEYQAEAIRRYAESRGIDIVRTYADEGKSGLKVDGREALQKLIRDVVTGETDFSLILVYDVSRWGRFQDADEGAYLEHLCKRAGIGVQYCAEQFENDGSLVATVLKNMKRAMAGEYSRDLSNKVFAGQCMHVMRGFRQGGMAGYGLRRLMIDHNGVPKTVLNFGERKSLQTDRVILIPGPDEEVATVNRIFRLFVEGRRTEREIAKLLNDEGIRTDSDRPWSRGKIHQLLTNEKYIGNNVFNRVSYKLKLQRVRNPPDLLVRAFGVFTPIVSAELFEAARLFIDDRNRHFSDQKMLDHLRVLVAAHGWLSALIIDEQDNMPSSGAYRHRFGSLIRAYALIGFTPARDYRYLEINRRLRALYPEFVQQVMSGIQEAGGSIEQDDETDLLWVNHEFTLSVVISRCFSTHAGSSRWKLRFDTGLKPDVTVAVRMDTSNAVAADYYLLPRLDFPQGAIRLAEENGLHFDAYRFETLQPLFELTRRRTLRRAA